MGECNWKQFFVFTSLLPLNVLSNCLMELYLDLSEWTKLHLIGRCQRALGEGVERLQLHAGRLISLAGCYWKPTVWWLRLLFNNTIDMPENVFCLEAGKLIIPPPCCHLQDKWYNLGTNSKFVTGNQMYLI